MLSPLKVYKLCFMTFTIILTLILASTCTNLIPTIKNMGKFNSVSEVVESNKALYYRLTAGFILSGTLQLLLMLSIFNNFSDFTSRLGIIFFVFGALAALGVSKFTLSSKRKLHLLFASIYFWGTSLGAFFISFGSESLFFTVCGFLVIWVLGSTWIYEYFNLGRRHVYYLELNHMLVSYFWMIGLIVYQY